MHRYIKKCNISQNHNVYPGPGFIYMVYLAINLHWHRDHLIHIIIRHPLRSHHNILHGLDHIDEIKLTPGVAYKIEAYSQWLGLAFAGGLEFESVH